MNGHSPRPISKPPLERRGDATRIFLNIVLVHHYDRGSTLPPVHSFRLGKLSPPRSLEYLLDYRFSLSLGLALIRHFLDARRSFRPLRFLLLFRNFACFVRTLCCGFSVLFNLLFDESYG